MTTVDQSVIYQWAALVQVQPRFVTALTHAVSALNLWPGIAVRTHHGDRDDNRLVHYNVDLCTGNPDGVCLPQDAAAGRSKENDASLSQAFDSVRLTGTLCLCSTGCRPAS